MGSHTSSAMWAGVRVMVLAMLAASMLTAIAAGGGYWVSGYFGAWVLITTHLRWRAYKAERERRRPVRYAYEPVRISGPSATPRFGGSHTDGGPQHLKAARRGR